MHILSTLSNDLQAPLALTIGNFDGVHVGHQAILHTLVQKAQEHTYRPAVMTFSPHAKVFFGNEKNFLISSNADKASLISRCGVQTLYQIPFNQKFSQISAHDFVEQLIQRLHVKYLLVGDDFRFGYQGQGTFQLLCEICDKHGINVHSTPTVSCDGQRVSSSRIRTAIRENDFAMAKKLLGRPLHYRGRVICGKRLGRSINFPTANIKLPDVRILPQGVFVVKVSIQNDDNPYYGMCNIGTKPTVDDLLIRQIEVNIFNFSGDLYDKELTVEPLEKLRSETKFDSVDALIQQLHRDKSKSLSILER